MMGPEFAGRLPGPPPHFPAIPPELMAALSGQPGGPMPVPVPLPFPGFVEQFSANGIPMSADPKKSAENEERQVGIRLLQTGNSSTQHYRD